jgi:hypothetical protein
MLAEQQSYSPTSSPGKLPESQERKKCKQQMMKRMNAFTARVVRSARRQAVNSPKPVQSIIQHNIWDHAITPEKNGWNR